MATTKRDFPEFWVTHLAKALVGDTTCLLQPWLLGQFRVDRRESDFNTAAWKTDHTAMITAKSEALREAGWNVKVENQNFFKFRGQTACVSGKPDLVTRKGQAVRVWDCKSGQPSDAHGAQVAIYVILLPMLWKTPDLRIDGAVVYRDHDVPVHWESVQPLREKFFRLVKDLATRARPTPLPSGPECRFCAISSVDCPDRIDEPAVDIHTSEF